MADQAFNLLHALDPTRDSYGFALRPQHTQRYRQYASIYKEEEEERSKRWKDFLEQTVQSSRSSSSEEDVTRITEPVKGDSSENDPGKDVHISEEKSRTVKKWGRVRSSLGAIEKLMSSRVKKRKKNWKDDPITEEENYIQPTETTRSLEANVDFQTEDSADNVSGDSRSASGSENEEGIGISGSERASMEELVVGDTAPEDDSFNYHLDGVGAETEKAGIDEEPLLYWKEELECLVQGGIPKDLRGEVWQAFAGVKTRREERYYRHLLAQEDDRNDTAARKWKRQIEKDLPRTFPGHPALNENGRDSLRRVLLAYARHNPSVGYCQAMNFFAGLLLLLMPEENAFWTLVGIMDDYFDGYYTEEMIESQVDQLVFEELMQERFPKLVNHLDYLGVQVAWISGPWFLSIFVNLLPWESVLRVWDVLLYDGNRVMLFRTAMALMELYGPALITTKDAADATTLLQSLVGSTFDNSQLVLTASMGFLAVTEARLDDLRCKHRPCVLEAIEERAKQGRVWKDSKGLATKLYSFKHDPKSLIEEKIVKEEKRDESHHTESRSSNLDDLLDHLAVVPEVDSLPDLQEQVVWLKVELCRLLEEKRSAILRAEELETALMEMVKQDNRRQLSARVEQLEQEVAYLHQALDDKREQEAAMLKVLMRVEHEQQLTEDARLSAEQEVATQKYALHVLQENYEKAMASIGDMKKRVVIAESTLEATLQYQSGKVKALSSPRTLPDQTQENTKRMVLLPFNLGWRDRNKPKPGNAEQSSESKSANEQIDPPN